MTDRMSAKEFRLTKPRAKRRDLEGPIHRAIVAELKRLYPAAVVHHSPNEIDLAGKNVAKAIAKQRWNGTVKGWPDIEMLFAGQFWTLEVKAGRNKPTDEQIECGRAIIEAGGRWAVVYSVEEAMRVVEGWRSEQ